MADRDEIVRYANGYLELEAHPDYGPMGLQVVGAQDVRKVVCGVSASLELFERAEKAGAHMVLVHHGLFWDKEPRVVDAALRARLEVLFRGDMSLVAYHLALDAHPEVGNNALLCRLLGADPSERFAGIGFGGSLTAPCAIDELVARVEAELGRPPLVFPSGPEEIRRIAVCTGGAAHFLRDVVADGYDCYVTGEAAEPTMMMAREAGIHFVAAGHYATETLGIRALTERLAGRFGFAWEFVELRNPV
jgi:dinuclear metal center YbgI/SA1388 family protein